MNVKKVIRKSIAWKGLSSGKRFLTLARLFVIDLYLFSKHSASSKMIGHEYSLRRTLIVNSHLVEKGLSHINFRPAFGKRQVKELREAVEEYAKLPEKDRYTLERGYGALVSYVKKNAAHGYDASQLLDGLRLESSVKVGSEEYTKLSDAAYMNMNFKEITESRKSVRLFESKSLPIADKVLDAIANLAYTAPAGCNKQSVKVYFVKDPLIKKKVLDLQGGSQGFGMNTGAIAVVTADLAEYRATERRLPYFDAGLFCMNFALAAKYYGCDTCMLNGSVERKNEKGILNAIGSGKREIVCLVFALSRLNEHQSILVPVSTRRSKERAIMHKKGSENGSPDKH